LAAYSKKPENYLLFRLQPVVNMNNTTLGKFVSDLPGYYSLNDHQQDNVARLIGISKKFLQRAGITSTTSEVISGTAIILESGHQPNFLPHAGTWKKAFLLHRIHTRLKENGNDSVAFFGFADQNLSTARVLTKNQLPAMNKDGLIKIGFKIGEGDRFKSFCSVDKPTPETWQKEITRIRHHYSDLAKKTRSEAVFPRKQWDTILEIVQKSYELATNAAELNAFIFAKICTGIFGLDLRFFRYSDIYPDNLFLEESKQILRNLPQYNQSYNRVIEQQGLDIPMVNPRHLPFWYTCDCGMKIDLEADESFVSVARCPLCNKEYELEFGDDFEHLSRYYKNMDFTAVSRSCALAHGLGDTLFISGVGGSLQYGRIADQVSRDLGFHRPVTLAWRSRDYYLGMAHRAAIHDLTRQFSLAPRDFLTPALSRKITRTFQEISGHIQEAESRNNKKEQKQWPGIYSNAGNQVVFAKNLFSMTPSFLDILANQDTEEIIHAWTGGLDHADISLVQGVHTIHKDIFYHPHLLSDIPPDNLPELYKNIRNIEVTQ
jgi:hypothetical protein